MTTWIFQGNPDFFEIGGYLATTKEILWSVNQSHLASNMRVGERVFLWRASGKSKVPAGVIAEAVIVDEPSVRPEDEASLPFWKVKGPSEEALRVGLRVLRIANEKEVIRREWLKDDPILRDLRILKLASETNYPLGEAQSIRLVTLWRNTNRDWDRSETVAGLWAYSRTLNGPVSKLPNSPIGEVACHIGRAVQGVYNKVMNFRALDPNDGRAGFSGGGALAEQVWNEFYDTQRGRLRGDDLNAEYQRLWQPTNDPTSPFGHPDQAADFSVDGMWADIRAAAHNALAHQVEFCSTKQGRRYRIQRVEDDKLYVERIDANEPASLSRREVERAAAKLAEGSSSVRRTGLFGTVAKEVATVYLSPFLRWSDDGDWIEIVGAPRAPSAVLRSYADFGQAPDDDPTNLQRFARKVRAGQPKFRKNLIRLYGGKCAISEWGPEAVLEAAHVLLHADSGLNHTDNGILLRSDLHTLFDDGLLKIHPESLTVVLDPSLRTTPYWELGGRLLRPRSDGSQPKRAFLAARRATAMGEQLSTGLVGVEG